MSQNCNTITAIAIDNDKNSHYALKWAIDNILVDSSNCVLLHVQTRSGESTEADSDDDDDDDDDYYKFFLPFRGFCTRKGIIAKEVILQDHDISNAIINYIINNNSISNLVIGASTNSFIKKFKNTDLPTNLLKRLPETCGVYVVSKGKLLRRKSANQRPQVSKPQALSSLLYGYDPTSSFSSDSERESVSKQNSVLSPQLSFSKTSQSEIGNESSPGECSETSTVSSYGISERFITNGSSDSSTSTVSSLMLQKEENQKLEAEVRKLRLELHQFNASQGRLNDTREAIVMSEALFEREKQKRQTAIKVAEMVKRLAKLESQKRRLLQMQAKMSNKVSYRRYSIRDVEDATNGFSDELKIGEGGYGPVYKAVLDHTSVAIKIMKSDITQGLKQFKREIEVLSCMRHPNMVVLLGACPEYGCLVYEYMENGTLEDRLFCRNNTPPLSWRTRFRIAAEIATGLLFLHQAKPDPLVHRDLKPTNILLDRYFISKISDVGLARLVPPSLADSLTQYHMTSAAGTFCYIDPEYQQTGMLGVKSDLYSFGVVLLQIITAMPAMGLGHKVEIAIEKNKFREILDPTVSEWPEEETLVLAKLALQCCELRKKDRPDLSSVLLPALKRLREFATEDHERIPYRTSYKSQTHNSALLDQVPSSQINPKKTMSVPEIDDPSLLKTQCDSIRSIKKPSRSHRSQYKDKFWSFISCAPPKRQWNDLP